MSRKVKCEKLKESISAYVDGYLSGSEADKTEKHINECGKCAGYYRSYKSIKTALDVDFIEPEYLESKIMAAVRQNTGNKRKALLPLFKTKIPAYGMSFSLAAVIVAAAFLIYNTSVKEPVFETAENTLPQEEAVSAASGDIEKNNAKKPAYNESQREKTVLKKVEEEAPESAEKTLKPAKKEVPVYVYSPPEKSEEKDSAVSGKSSEDTAIRKDTEFYAAKTGETPGITPRLEEEKAVVANNLLNPYSGSPAVIRVKVEETAFVRVIIYDKNVRIVKTLVREDKAPGVYEIPWYGKNEGNEIVREGVYFVLIQIGRRVIKENIVVSR
ncbi:MAG: zf-HC2 domain-containing protein [Candidatus Goldiibacteriota bacterium]